jgi:hypothetical protein
MGAVAISIERRVSAIAIGVEGVAAPANRPIARSCHTGCLPRSPRGGFGIRKTKRAWPGVFNLHGELEITVEVAFIPRAFDHSEPVVIRRKRIGRPASFAISAIALDGFYTKQDYPVHLRRVRFKDPETGKTLVFLSN